MNTKGTLLESGAPDLIMINTKQPLLEFGAPDEHQRSYFLNLGPLMTSKLVRGHFFNLVLPMNTKGPLFKAPGEQQGLLLKARSFDGIFVICVWFWHISFLFLFCSNYGPFTMWHCNKQFISRQLL